MGDCKCSTKSYCRNTSVATFTTDFISMLVEYKYIKNLTNIQHTLQQLQMYHD